MLLSKSQFVRGIKCPKSLWLYKKAPDVPRDLPDAQQKALFATGHRVGDLAKELFPGGDEIAFDSKNFDGMACRTRELIDNGVSTIYEATFRSANGFAMVDILHRGDKGWEMYEVKASASVKDYHLWDAAFQYRVLRACGMEPLKVAIVHIDNSYVRGEELEVERLFAIEDVTEEILAMQEKVGMRMQAFDKLLSGPEPDIDIGEQCSIFYDCDYHGHCWAHVPSPSVFDLYRMGDARKFEMYRSGIVRYEDIPDDFPLNPIQRIQIETAKSGEIHVNPSVIETFLEKLCFPLNFFDFETFQEAIPRFKGQRPYMQMPFQYSIHILHENGMLEHREFLGDEHHDPRRELVERMLEDITPRGSIVAFNRSFEISRIRELAEAFPEYRNRLLKLEERFVDLIEPFRGLGYYHPDFNGSFSIKSVLPALFPDDPELDYTALAIQNGGMAMDVFGNLHRLKDQKKREEIRRSLLAYCRLDTLAMVRIYEKLKEEVVHGDDR